jgi:hypothetical protein
MTTGALAPVMPEEWQPEIANSRSITNFFTPEKRRDDFVAARKLLMNFASASKLIP